MIELKDIEQLANEVLSNELSDKGIYIVDISVSSNAVISILIDSFEGIAIQDCIILSKNIEKNIDREKQDFELNVSSAGLSSPFKVLKQYQKNINKDIEIFTKKNQKLKVTLLSVDEEGIVVQEKTKQKIEGKKRNKK